MGFGDTGESGTYSYDGSGNIIAIGPDSFLYDAEGRLVTAVVRGVQGTYAYDAFGNRKAATGETNCLGQSVCASPLTVSPGTNHLLTTTNNNVTANVGYDAAGNITAASGGIYTYDGTGMMTRATVGTDDRQFVYTADDERIAVRQGQSWTWTVRGLDNKVLREFTSVEPNNSPGLPTPGGQWEKDYAWRDGLLLASTDVTGTYHYHLDHLGTPRLVTNMSHTKVAEHAYYSFGAEISLTPHESIEEAMKFTSHERDLVAGDGHTLDDMHARYYNASLGRLLEIDPGPVDPKVPQSWNRYSYVRNNPIDLTDPTGKADDDGPKLDDLHLVLVDNPYDIFHVDSTADYREGDDIGAAIHAQNKKIQDATVFTAELLKEVAVNWAMVFMPGLGAARTAAMESTEYAIYRSVASDGAVNYIGMTKSFAARAAAHLRLKGIAIEAIDGLEGFSYRQARAVEQLLIAEHGLSRAGGSLLNKINSIAARNLPGYAKELKEGLEILSNMRYPGFF
jgi:RHS repeat-associated protein